MNNQNSLDTIDQRILNDLNLLRPVPPRDPELEAETRSKFIWELNAVFPEEAWVNSRAFVIKDTIFSNIVRNFLQLYPSNKPVLSLFIGIFLIFVFMFGGASITARASKAALPGDALYSIKTGLEQARVSFSHDLFHQAELYMEFSDNRLDEISQLIELGRYSDAFALTDDFRYFSDKALDSIDQLSTIDSEKAAVLKEEINLRHSEYNRVLEELIIGLSADLQPKIPSGVPIAPSAVTGEENENSDEYSNLNDNGNVNNNEDGNFNDNGYPESEQNGNEELNSNIYEVENDANVDNTGDGSEDEINSNEDDLNSQEDNGIESYDNGSSDDREENIFNGDY